MAVNNTGLNLVLPDSTIAFVIASLGNVQIVGRSPDLGEWFWLQQQLREPGSYR